jgi:hypothetical protein
MESSQPLCLAIRIVVSVVAVVELNLIGKWGSRWNFLVWQPFDQYTLGTLIGKTDLSDVERMKLSTRDRERRNAVPCKFECMN